MENSKEELETKLLQKYLEVTDKILEFHTIKKEIGNISNDDTNKIIHSLNLLGQITLKHLKPSATITFDRELRNNV